MLEEIQSREKQSTEATFFFALSWGGGRPAAEGRGGGGHGDQGKRGVGDGTVDKTAQNELYDTLDDTILDFSESNPFGDVGTKG